MKKTLFTFLFFTILRSIHASETSRNEQINAAKKQVSTLASLADDAFKKPGKSGSLLAALTNPNIIEKLKDAGLVQECSGQMYCGCSGCS